MRLRASASISSRVPYRRASAGQAFTQAGIAIVLANCLAPASSSGDVGLPLNDTAGGWRARSAQCVHFEIFGDREFHSAVGTSHGHASMQYRQPMQSSELYETGPSDCRYNAVVGHA